MLRTLVLLLLIVAIGFFAAMKLRAIRALEHSTAVAERMLGDRSPGDDYKLAGDPDAAEKAFRRETAGAPAAAVNLDKILATRVIDVTILAGPGDLPDGGPSVSGERLINRAQLAAPTMAQNECKALLATIAATCAIRSAEAQEFPGRRGLENVVFVMLRLVITPKDKFGAYDPKAKLSFADLSERLTGADEWSRPMQRQLQEDQRRDYYLAAVAACDRLREQNGNCAIRQIEIRAIAYQDDPSFVQMSAKAHMSTLTRQSE